MRCHFSRAFDGTEMEALNVLSPQGQKLFNLNIIYYSDWLRILINIRYGRLGVSERYVLIAFGSTFESSPSGIPLIGAFLDADCRHLGSRHSLEQGAATASFRRIL